MLELVSQDRRFGICVPESALSAIHEYCRRAHPKETGGILIGFYNNNQRRATVTHVTGPPRDSHSDRCRFSRGIDGLAAMLLRRWQRRPRTYYLGEWHYHPAADVTPSTRDREQMREFAANPAVACREPLLLIVGSEHAGWPMNVEVYRDTGPPIVLDPADPP